MAWRAPARRRQEVDERTSVLYAKTNWLDEDEDAVSHDLCLRIYSTNRLPDPFSTPIIRTPARTLIFKFMYIRILHVPTVGTNGSKFFLTR